MTPEQSTDPALEGAAPPLTPLASRIEQDIRRRGLAPGDPYLTAAQAGERFQVGRSC